MGGCATISARGGYSAPRRFLRVKFVLQVKRLRTLIRARQQAMEDESL